MSEWDDQGTYLERDPEDTAQLTIDEACADLDEPTIKTAGLARAEYRFVWKGGKPGACVSVDPHENWLAPGFVDSGTWERRYVTEWESFAYDPANQRERS